MGTTIIVCMTLLLITVAVCVTVVLVRMYETDQHNAVRENRELRKLIDNLKTEKENESDCC